jgi:hypothetical protein
MSFQHKSYIPRIFADSASVAEVGIKSLSIVAQKPLRLQQRPWEKDLVKLGENEWFHKILLILDPKHKFSVNSCLIAMGTLQAPAASGDETRSDPCAVRSASHWEAQKLITVF